MFRSGYDAISWARRRTKTPIIDSPSIWRLASKSGYHDVLPTLNRWEKLAEASLIVLNIHRACTPIEAAAVWTYFTGGTVIGTEQLTRHVSKQLGKDRWFVRDCVLSWSRDRPKHSQKWWAKKYGVSEMAVSRWSTSVKRMLDNSFRNGLAKTEDRLYETGHVS